MSHVGLWMRTEPFTHGQLYVAISRVGKPSSLKFALMAERNGTPKTVKNTVFTEVLLKK